MPSERPEWSDLTSDESLRLLLEKISGYPTATQLQESLLQGGHVHSKDNLVLAASTNSGKSTISTVLMAESVRTGGTAVLIEPLKAIAKERFDELNRSLADLSAYAGRRVRARLMSGDTALNGDELDAPPPGNASIVVATPERLEALWRKGDADEWLGSVRCVVVDEFHMVMDDHRGPTLDAVISSFLALETPPKVILMSATPPDLMRVQEVLEPCEVVVIPTRTPPLEIRVASLDSGEDANGAVFELLNSELPKGKCIVFVSTVVQAESLVRLIAGRIQGSNAVAYHASLTSAEKQLRAEAFKSGACHVLVSTTALGMGVNLPASTIIVRDVNLHGRGRLSAQELSQMLGRDGRGTSAGTGYVVLRPTDPWGVTELVQAIDSGSHEESRCEYAEEKPSTRQIAAILARRQKEPVTREEMQALASRSLRGPLDADALDSGLRWMADPRVILTHEEDEGFVLTTLGTLGTQSMLPLELVAGFGRLIRNLLDADLMEIVEALTPIDLLATAYIVLKPKLVVRWTNALPSYLESFFESGDPSALFAAFGSGEMGRSKAIQLVNAVVKERVRSEQEAYKLLCRAYAMAAIASSLAKGLHVDRIERMWGISNLDGSRERIRDDALFYLLGLRRLMEVRAFYFHLKSRKVSVETLERFGDALQSLQSKCLLFSTLVAYSSPFGALVARLRGSKSSGVTTSVGLRTLRKLEAISGSDLNRLRGMTIDELVSHGIRRTVAGRIVESLKST
jgi:superfamily II DNA/RNA helicase